MSEGESDDLAILVHELRSPVAALVAIADAYPTSDATRRARLLELAEAAVMSIERLLAGTTPAALSAGRVDVTRLVRDAAETAALASTERSIVFDVAVESGLLIEGDREQLRQALDNLIGNAIGHSPLGGVVRLSARRIDTTVAIEVADEGDGIPAADVERVFEAGVRLTSDRPGSGLGLAVVRAVARAHGGEVEIESAPGQGSLFRLVLPGASGAP